MSLFPSSLFASSLWRSVFFLIISELRLGVKFSYAKPRCLMKGVYACLEHDMVFRNLLKKPKKGLV